MKLTYESPMEELRQLLAEAETKPRVRISVTKSEMAAIVRHGDARALFPGYFKRIDTRKMQIKTKLNETSKRLSNPSITPEEQQSYWDDQTRLDRQLRAIEDEVPNELRLDRQAKAVEGEELPINPNVVVSVSMLA